MKFNDLPYKRPKLDEFVKAFESLLEKFAQADSFEEQSDIFKQINENRQEFSSMNSLCRIRHTIDTRDEFYEKEK